jgi:hypothetical protein
MTTSIQLSGTLTTTDDATSTGSAGTCSKQLVLGPTATAGSRQYQAKVESTMELLTAAGTFVDLDGVDTLTEVRLLYLKTSANVVLRLYAVPAQAQAVTGTFPTTFAGGETLITTIDGTVVTTTFQVGDQTAAQCAARINAAMALAGFATPRATVVNGQLLITGVATAVDGAAGILSFAGTGAATLALDTATLTPTDALGQDVDINGLYIQEFPWTGGLAPTAVQISGQSTVDVTAAGQS